MILPGFLIGVAATAATWIVVRLFPKQKYPKDNALVAAIGFGGAYFAHTKIEALLKKYGIK